MNAIKIFVKNCVESGGIFAGDWIATQIAEWTKRNGTISLSLALSLLIQPDSRKVQLTRHCTYSELDDKV